MTTWSQSFIKAIAIAVLALGSSVCAQGDDLDLKFEKLYPSARIDGTPWVGQTLIVNRNTWVLRYKKPWKYPEGTTTYEWLSCDMKGEHCVLAKGKRSGCPSKGSCTPFPGEGGLSHTYVNHESDVGRTIKARVRVYNGTAKIVDFLSRQSWEFIQPQGWIYNPTPSPTLYLVSPTALNKDLVSTLPNATKSTASNMLFRFLVGTDYYTQVKVQLDGVDRPAKFNQTSDQGTFVGEFRATNLKPGPHSVKLIATSSGGTSETSYNWTVVKAKRNLLRTESEQ